MITKESRIHEGDNGSLLTISREQKNNDDPKYLIIAESTLSIIKLCSGSIQNIRTFLDGLIKSLDELKPND